MTNTIPKGRNILVLGGQNSPPYTDEEVLNFLKNGNITLETLVWRPESSSSVPLAQLPEFSQAVPQAPHLRVISSSQSEPQPQQPTYTHNLQDEYYEKNVFPLIAAGKNVFNWEFLSLVLIYNGFWLAYKGLWAEVAALCAVYFVFFSSISNVSDETYGTLAVGFNIFIGVVLGFFINKHYYRRYMQWKSEGTLKGKGNIGAGVAFQAQ